MRLPGSGGGTFAPAPFECRSSIALDQSEQAFSALIAQHLADEPPELMNVLAQPGILGLELNGLPIHSARSAW